MTMSWLPQQLAVQMFIAFPSLTNIWVFKDKKSRNFDSLITVE